MGDMELGGEEDQTISQELPRYYSEDEANFSKWQLDPDGTLEAIVHNLRGEKQKVDTGEWYSPRGSVPLMNELGIQSVVSSIKFVINKDTALSNLTENDIKDMCNRRGLYLADNLSSHLYEYGIDPRNFPTIVNDIMDNIYIYLRRAKEGETLHGFQRVYRLFEKTGGEQTKERGGGFKLGFFGSGKGGK